MRWLQHRDQRQREHANPKHDDPIPGVTNDFYIQHGSTKCRVDIAAAKNLNVSRSASATARNWASASDLHDDLIHEGEEEKRTDCH